MRLHNSGVLFFVELRKYGISQAFFKFFALCNNAGFALIYQSQGVGCLVIGLRMWA